MLKSSRAKTAPSPAKATPSSRRRPCRCLNRIHRPLPSAAPLKHGHRILDRNWRNRWCELDIVTRDHATTHFIEVKYRRTSAYGAPAEYISRDKVARLTRSALAWCQAHAYAGPYQIDIVGVSGSLAESTIEVIESVIQA